MIFCTLGEENVIGGNAKIVWRFNCSMILNLIR